MASISLNPSGYDEVNFVAQNTPSASDIIGKGVENTSNDFEIVVGVTAGTTGRVYLTFDTSQIPQNATIESVMLRCRITKGTWCDISYVYGLYDTSRNIIGSYGNGTMVSSSASRMLSKTYTDIDRNTLDGMVFGIIPQIANTYSGGYEHSFFINGALLQIDYTINESGGGGGDDPEPTPDPQPSGDAIDFPFTGSVQSRTLSAGKYLLEAWGAQGGSWNGNEGGKGGYSTGLLTLSQDTAIYVYVGGQPDTVTGTSSSVPGGFNGGGKGQNRTWSNVTTYGQGGGGASDIRIGQDSLYSRVLVAGGGGGVASTNGTNKYGGGMSGGSGGQSESASYIAGQTAPSSSGEFIAGTFGQGADAYQEKNNYQHGSGGGGGGWYGGYAYDDANDNSEEFWGYNGGGSGYVYAADTARNYPSGCLLNSSYYLVDASTGTGEIQVSSPYEGLEVGHSGNGFVRITPISDSPDTPGEEEDFYKVYEYDGQNEPYTLALDPGLYAIGCWGAQGGTYQSNEGGKGGYSTGYLAIEQPTTVYVNVGQQPPTTTTRQSATPGGYNGGGNGFNRDYSNTYTYGQGGGGASDVRIGSNDLYARVIVAGGGGGSAGNNDANKFGGGLNAGAGSQQQSVTYNAKQTAPTTSNRYLAGTFGQGANAYTQRKNYKYGSGGGGGGWYGGYAYNYADDNGTAYQGYNGGGSGYVYTESTASNYPSGCLLNSSYYLTQASTKGGNESFNSPTGTPETGHSGHGCVVIMKIGNITELDTKLYIKVNGAWKKVKKVYINMFGEWVEMTESTLSEWKQEHPNGTALDCVE